MSQHRPVVGQSVGHHVGPIGSGQSEESKRISKRFEKFDFMVIYSVFMYPHMLTDINNEQQIFHLSKSLKMQPRASQLLAGLCSPSAVALASGLAATVHN